MTYSGCHAVPHLQSRAKYTRRNLLSEQDVPVSREWESLFRTSTAAMNESTENMTDHLGIFMSKPNLRYFLHLHSRRRFLLGEKANRNATTRERNKTSNLSATTETLMDRHSRKRLELLFHKLKKINQTW